jgi:mannose-1-phosphate guanylyltransferase/mannose-6-phosphate isomerase
MTTRILPAIMSGGSGTRLWPASTEARPKQFHALAGARTLIGETVERVRGQAGGLWFAPPMVLANVSHADLIARALSAMNVQPSAIVLEPSPRNTAAVGAIAAALGAELEPDALVLLLPADHQINDRAAFLATIERAAPFARERIVTFGINPDRPETGYGYIKRGAELGAGVYAIDSFREKPNAATAREYLEHGGYAWNSGMFLFSPRVMLEEFSQSADVRDAALQSLRLARRSGVEIRLDEAAFNKTPSVPLDVAVMEKTKRGAVAPCDIGWADLGSWDEIWRLSPKDASGNAVHGKVVTLDAEGNLLHADGVTLSVAGVSDLIVVATGDAVLILPRSRAQEVKRLKELAEKL